MDGSRSSGGAAFLTDDFLTNELTGSLEDWTLAVDRAATAALRAERRAAG
jgi:hypothetical protein